MGCFFSKEKKAIGFGYFDKERFNNSKTIDKYVYYINEKNQYVLVTDIFSQKIDVNLSNCYNHLIYMGELKLFVGKFNFNVNFPNSNNIPFHVDCI